MSGRAAVEFELRSLRERLVHVHVLTCKSQRIECKVNTITELIVEVDRVERVLVREKRLLKPSFDTAIGFWLQVRIRNDAEAAHAESFFKPGLLDSLCVTPVKTESTERTATVP